MDYRGDYNYCYCTKSSHFSFVLEEVLKNQVNLETSSAFDINLIQELYAQGLITKDIFIICNGYKRNLYIENIAGMIQEGFHNMIPVIDNKGEIDLLNDALPSVKEPVKIGQDIKEAWPIDDIVLEIDNKSLTNRPDLWGHYGLAREFAAIFDRPLKKMPVDDLTKYNDLNTPMTNFFNINLGFNTGLHYLNGYYPQRHYSFTGFGGGIIRGYPHKTQESYLDSELKRCGINDS